jgi:transposase
VKNLWKRYRETGSVAPKPHGGGQTPTICAEGFKFLWETVKKPPDFTRDELTIIYNNPWKNPVSASTIGRAFLKLNRQKKRLATPENISFLINWKPNFTN